ncbi:sorting nexin-13 isoform X1 [Rattus norvegicus]|uniref:Sorting nexin 13 n=2 Tax=Rattus norvegicus TaxID=10116 RepID=A0A8I6GI34_RAT|nr:sorting nexin-13 isoform X1 [Rattus norvegicus]|eukprot:XP_006240084.1 PREDICTED: sorting nexin-13 isoform X1 [Rattus norvegicus]
MRRGAGGSFRSPRDGGDHSRVSRALYGLHRVGELRDGSFSASTQSALRHQPVYRPPPWSRIQPAAEVPDRARPNPRLRPCARRRHGDSHKTLAPGPPANGSARRGETRTSLFQDGGASVASSRAGGKPAKPSKAAARDRTEAAVAAVGGGPGSFRCCYGCCHAARLGRTSLPRGVMMLTEASLSIWGWGSLGIVLFLITFGPFVIFYLAFYILCFVGGGLVVTLLYGKTNSEKYLEQCEHSFLPPTSPGVPKCLEEMKREARTIKIDRRLTGANIIDEPLQQVIQFSLRDYVQYWYYTLSDDETFLLEIRQTLQNALIQFATRSKEIDWQPYFTTRMVDDFGTHLRVFRKAQQRVTEKDDQVKGTAEDLVETFFEVEVEMEKDVCRDLVCTSPKDEEGFLRDLCEVLLYLLLPPGDFQSKIMRYFVREILARGILLPLINQLSDPDYINQYVIWMIRDSNCNYEAFMNIIKLSDNIGELEAVRDKAAEELQYLRSLDTAGDDINTIKNQINSLLFVKKVCDSRIQRLQSGKEINTVKLAANFGKLCTVPLDSILVDNVALQFFMDYMQQTGGQAHLFFWMTVEGYRVTAQQQLEVLSSRQRDGKQQTNQTKGLLRAAAVGIYEQYLSEKASPRVIVDDYLVAKLADTLNHEDPTPEIFDDIQRKVYELMLRDERFYPSFRQNPLYVRMLAELDMLKDPSFRGSDDGDGESFNGSPTGSINLSLDDLSSVTSDDSVQLHAYISDTVYADYDPYAVAGVCNDHGKTYALYAITVHRRSLNTEEMWKTYRRYSDFHDFHMRITEQFENLSSILKLPGKKTFNNMDRDFLEKRKKDLNAYLQLLLTPEMLKASPALAHCVYDFLENKAYSKGKGDFARKMDTFVNPLRNSMRNVSNAVKSLPDSLAEGVTKMSDNVGRMSERLGQDIKQSFFKVPPLITKTDSDPEHCRVSAQLDDNVDDNIPLRVMLLLMDEVFDLKERNQWLRRNIKNLLQQLIRATYGDTINRKIVDHVDWMTSPEQVADSVKRFRDALWPNGILAEAAPCRDKAIRMRTRIAGKTKLFAVMPDELKHIIGAETTRKGILRVFEMFQHNQLNRRMVYVFLEGFLETLFPQYKFRELFNKLHSRSKQMQKYKQKLQSTQAPSLQKR